MRRTLAALVVVPYALLVARFRFTCDDAYITFRCAKNLARGRGLTFNPGESPPVEGYSNLLWALFLSPFEAAGLDVALVANLASVACGVALVALTGRFLVRRLDLCAAGTTAAALFLATLPPVAVWSTGGLETMPFALAVFAVFHALSSDPERPRWTAAAGATVAAVLLRADGFVWVGTILAASWVGRPRDARLVRAIALTGAAATAVVLCHFLWRHSYYGEWVPNTARAKAGLSLARLGRGWGYLVSFLLAVPSIALVSLSGGLVRGEVRGTVALQALLVLVTGAAYAVFVGGDFMAMGRFLVPVAPFAALVFAAVSAPWRLASRVGFAALLVGANLLACFDLVPVPAVLRQRLHFRWNTAEARSEVEQWAYMRSNGVELEHLGRALALHTAPGESMIRSSVGAPGYFTELTLFDRNGLVSPEVVGESAPLERASPGHDRRVEPSFFFDRRPTYYGAKLVPEGSPLGTGLGREAQRLMAENRLEVLRRPLPEGEGFPQSVELQLLRMRWTR